MNSSPYRYRTNHTVARLGRAIASGSALGALFFGASAASAQESPVVAPPSSVTQEGPAVAPPPPISTTAVDPAASSVQSAPPANVPPRPDEEAEHNVWPNRPMMVTGGALLALSYGAAAIVGAVSDRDSDDKLFYPVIGPWLDLKDRDCDVEPCGHKTRDKVLIAGDGVLQGIGAVTLLLGLVIPESKTQHWYLIGSERLHVSPLVSQRATGLSATGNF